jgi:hypothetical protein
MLGHGYAEMLQTLAGYQPGCIPTHPTKGNIQETFNEAFFFVKTTTISETKNLPEHEHSIIMSYKISNYFFHEISKCILNFSVSLQILYKLQRNIESF